MNKSDNRALALPTPASEKADSRNVAVKKRAKPRLLNSNSAVSAKKLREREEDERILGALEKLEDSSGIRARSLSGRLLFQTASATLHHWGLKDGTPGQRLELAASALAEMEPSNAMEAMLANQMIAVNDAALLFVNQTTLTESTLQQRDANTERACKFLTIFVQQVDAMQRLKGKAGRQRVTVEHVNVHAGGQAIVGAVAARGPGEGVGDDTENR
jgi:hypothetical protein